MRSAAGRSRRKLCGLLSSTAYRHHFGLAERAQLTERIAIIERLNTKLAHIVAELRRAHFGRKSERITDDQLALALDELETAAAKVNAEAEKADPVRKAAAARKRRASRDEKLDHLPHEEEEVVVEPESKVCPCCGGELHVIGEDTSKRLDKVPTKVTVIVTRRPKYACRTCEKGGSDQVAGIVQTPAPRRLIEGGLLTERLVADVVVSKCADHLPLYRQSQILARHGVTIERSTLAQWVGAVVPPRSSAHPLLLICRHYHARSQADDPPILPSEIVEPPYRSAVNGWPSVHWTGTRFLSAYHRAAEAFEGNRHRVVLGISHHLVGPDFPLILKHMTDVEPSCVIEIRVDSSHALIRDYDSDLLDGIVLMRQEGDRREGEVICNEPLRWYGAIDWKHDPAQPLPLATQAAPCGLRSLSIEALNRADIAWTEIFIGGSVAVLGSAIKAVLAVGVLARRMAPVGVEDVTSIILTARTSDQPIKRALQRFRAAFRAALVG